MDFILLKQLVFNQEDLENFAVQSEIEVEQAIESGTEAIINYASINDNARILNTFISADMLPFLKIITSEQPIMRKNEPIFVCTLSFRSADYSFQIQNVVGLSSEILTKLTKEYDKRKSANVKKDLTK